MLTVAHAIVEDIRSVKFRIKGNTSIRQTENTTDVYSKSLISCADIRLSDPQCCMTSYSKETSTCRIDTSKSERCSNETEPQERWRFIQRNSYPKMTCTGCISFDNSLYLISEDQLDWTTVKEECEHLGGKLVELETSNENEFIKNEVRTRNTGVSGYWIGGYDFYSDNDMEW
ncbi:Hypothetical predicted protein [Mytilus galloprovincialis]|uniref:C-type lectin domain-containing protein n=1 Tax=Mytilus galloprovincialis TaxID=29158 RepID=A0A8B6BLK0_MYTGA|nr:Hypothetical predicted protein [Mytilus galloprovincialis]